MLKGYLIKQGLKRVNEQVCRFIETKKAGRTEMLFDGLKLNVSIFITCSDLLLI